MKNTTCKAYARKKRTEKILQSMGVSTNQWLPCVEPEGWAKLRTPQEVARRVLVLEVMVLKFNFPNESGFVQLLMSKGLWQHASPQEKIFFAASYVSQQDMFNASWRSEAMWVLLWALRIIPDLGIPDQQCDPDYIYEIMKPKIQIPKKFIKRAKLRSVSEILDAADFICQAHWAARDSRLYGKSNCGNLDEEILTEWHHAINWLICYQDEDWDDVTTDT